MTSTDSHFYGWNFFCHYRLFLTTLVFCESVCTPRVSRKLHISFTLTFLLTFFSTLRWYSLFSQIFSTIFSSFLMSRKFAFLHSEERLSSSKNCICVFAVSFFDGRRSFSLPQLVEYLHFSCNLQRYESGLKLQILKLRCFSFPFSDLETVYVVAFLFNGIIIAWLSSDLEIWCNSLRFYLL